MKSYRSPILHRSPTGAPVSDPATDSHTLGTRCKAALPPSRNLFYSALFLALGARPAETHQSCQPGRGPKHGSRLQSPRRFLSTFGESCCIHPRVCFFLAFVNSLSIWTLPRAWWKSRGGSPPCHRWRRARAWSMGVREELATPIATSSTNLRAGRARQKLL